MRFGNLLVFASLTAVVLNTAGLAGQNSAEPVALPPALERVLTDYESAWTAGDENRLADLFVSDGLVVTENRWVRGRDAILEAYENSSGQLHLWAIEYAVDGDTGFIVGVFGYEDTVRTARGKFMLALRRNEAGRWLIVADLDR